jgi:hypothetical protein
VFLHSPQPYTVVCNHQVSGGFSITVCLDHPVARNEALLDEALLGLDYPQAAYEAFCNSAPALPTVQPKASLSKAKIKAPTTATPKSTGIARKKTRLNPRRRKAKALAEEAASLQILPPTAPWLTLPEFFQHLWNLSPATPQVSLPSILGLTALVSTLIQCVLPRIHLPTIRSGTWSLVSYGLQWLIALHAKAIASAWDLITQTHLELRGQVNAGKSHCGSAEELFRILALSLSSPCFSQICYLPPHYYDYDRLSLRRQSPVRISIHMTNQNHSTTQLCLCKSRRICHWMDR